jgi:hypothetical protein
VRHRCCNTPAFAACAEAKPVPGNERRFDLIIQCEVAALGAERHLERIDELADAAQNGLPRFLAVGLTYERPWA